MNDDGIYINDRLTIPAAELTESFQTSGGPGGQHANRSATGVALVWDFAASSVLNAAQRARLNAGLGSRASNGVLRVVADKSRSQWRNRSLARSRMADLVAEAIRPSPRPRRPTKPSKSAQRRRVDEKKRRGRTKDLRKRPEPE